MSESARVSEKKSEVAKEDIISQTRKSNYSQSTNSSVDRILFFQRTIGNQAVAKLIDSGALQAKLKVNGLGDTYEQEADRIADQMMAAPADPVSGASLHIQRFSGQSNGQMDSAPASVDHALASPGRSLDPGLRQDMEQRFGHDFSRVRVHSDGAAGQSAQDVSAHAYTVGQDIVFGAGRFAPETREGRRMLSHELTHVVQQSGVVQGMRGLSVQRKPDDKTKTGDVTQEETEALINFKDDWRNNFSHYDQLIKISGRSYNKDQKEGIKAVKKGNSISITLGKPYFTQSDEKIRWQWIKREVIDKHVKTDKFEDIAYDPTHSKLNEIAPPYAAGQYCALNCPATYGVNPTSFLSAETQ